MKISTWVLAVSALALSVAVQTPDAASAPALPFFSGDLVVQAKAKGGDRCGGYCENKCGGKGPACSLVCMDKCRSSRR